MPPRLRVYVLEFSLSRVYLLALKEQPETDEPNEQLQKLEFQPETQNPKPRNPKPRNPDRILDARARIRQPWPCNHTLLGLLLRAPNKGAKFLNQVPRLPFILYLIKIPTRKKHPFRLPVCLTMGSLSRFGVPRDSFVFKGARP